MVALTSIREVADHFGLAISTLHYWERRGLVVPHRRSGWRYYDEGQVYRVALVQMWRQSGLMGIDEIVELLSVSERWADVIQARVADIDAQMARLASARRYLTHLSDCPHGPVLEDCPEFREQVDIPRSRPAAG